MRVCHLKQVVSSNWPAANHRVPVRLDYRSPILAAILLLLCSFPFSSDATAKSTDTALDTYRPFTAPLVIAHRGASCCRPEETLAAYALAVRQGADFLETDLCSTA
jgi:glycerophosphoryl diester phosphodiesterase